MAIRSLVMQLYLKNGDVQSHLDVLFTSCDKEKRQPSVDALCETFQSMVHQAGEVYIVLDALDECRTLKEYQTGGLLPWIQSLISQQVNVHLFATSRQEHSIASTIESWVCHRDFVAIQAQVSEDISSYVHARVREYCGLKRWYSRPEVQDEIEAVLKKQANGM